MKSRAGNFASAAALAATAHRAGAGAMSSFGAGALMGLSAGGLFLAGGLPRPVERKTDLTTDRKAVRQDIAAAVLGHDAKRRSSARRAVLILFVARQPRRR